MAGISNMPSNFCSYLDTFLAGEKDASFERHLMLDMCPCVRQVKRTHHPQDHCVCSGFSTSTSYLVMSFLSKPNA